jgi:hypothetical protein
MKRSILLAILLVVAGACTHSPTSPAAAVEVAPPSFNGHTFGSGNRADHRSGDGLTTDAAAASMETTASDSTGRNGQTFGSGN